MRASVTLAEIEALVPLTDRALHGERWYPPNSEPVVMQGRREILALERKERLAKQQAAEQPQPRAAELEALRSEVDGIQSFIQHEMVKGIADGLKRALPGLIAKHTGKLVSQINALEEKVADLEAKQVKFRGVWRQDQAYPANCLVIRSGGLWISLTSTTEPPGSSDDWRLCTKSGQVEPRKAPAVA